MRDIHITFEKDGSISGLIDADLIYGILNKLDYVAIVTDMDGNIIFANNPILEVVGLTHSDVKGKKIYDIIPSIANHDELMALIDEMKQNGGDLHRERKITIRGKVQFFDTTITTYHLVDHERLLYLSKDITALRESEIKTHELNSMLNKIIDNLPVYLFVKDVDDDLRYVIWNKAFATYSKIPADKVIGRTDFEVFPDKKDAQQFRDDDLAVIKSGEMATKQETYMAADGHTRVVQTYKTLVERKGQGPLLVGISLDVTNIDGIEQELIEARLRAEESDRLKSRFLANMSHEIRTPLNAIVGFAGLLADTDDEQVRQQFLNIINENTELLLQLINDILDLSKIEAGTLDYSRAPMDLYDTCNNLLLVYKHKIGPEVDLVFDNATSPCRFIINEDRNRITQVIDNLLNNAVKFTPHGAIHYGFIVKGDNIEVYVSDTGKGIPHDKHDQIFERFFKLDNFSQGSGLGLSICKLIVETMGGKMTVQSEDGMGSTFTFTIPYRKDRALNAPDIFTSKPSVHTHKDSSDHVILIAEDINSNFLVVKNMIKGRYEILWAQNGTEAVQMARENNPDLILMDIKMPEMDGLEATREIRKFDSEVPIVALTGNAFDQDRTLATHAGMNDFLPKPLNRDAFEAVLATYLT